MTPQNETPPPEGDFSSLLPPAVESPLAAATPQSLDELFAKDPLELSDQDVEKITTVLRQRRNIWQAAEASAKADGKKRTTMPKAGKAPKPGVVPLPPGTKLELKDLGLDL